MAFQDLGRGHEFPWRSCRRAGSRLAVRSPLPLMYSSGTGSEVVSRIAAPMVGGMLSAVILTLLVLPCVYYLWKCRHVNHA